MVIKLLYRVHSESFCSIFKGIEPKQNMTEDIALF